MGLRRGSNRTPSHGTTYSKLAGDGGTLDRNFRELRSIVQQLALNLVTYGAPLRCGVVLSAEQRPLHHRAGVGNDYLFQVLAAGPALSPLALDNARDVGGQTQLRSSDTLVPPNPNELLSACFIAVGRASLPTTLIAHSGSGVS